jgi:hypothetical protein
MLTVFLIQCAVQMDTRFVVSPHNNDNTTISVLRRQSQPITTLTQWCVDKALKTKTCSVGDVSTTSSTLSAVSIPSYGRDIDHSLEWVLHQQSIRGKLQIECCE